MEDSISIPFTIPGVYQGLASVAGLLHVGEDAIRIEFRVSDAVFGVLKSRVRDLEFPLADLESVIFRNGWFRKRLLIHARRLSLIADVPGTSEGYIVLRIKRRYRHLAYECVSRITLGISEARLRAIERRAERDADRLYG
jgi:hypothetical protein